MCVNKCECKCGTCELKRVATRYDPLERPGDIKFFFFFAKSRAAAQRFVELPLPQ